MKHFFFTPLVLLSALSLNACQECSQAGCSTQVTVSFAEDDGREPGRYVLVVEADIGRAECRFTLDAGLDVAAGGAGGENAGGSEAGAPTQPECTGTLARRLNPLILEQRFAGFSLDDFGSDVTAKEISFSVTRDDVELISKTFEPDYEDSYPNGEGCGPVCPEAEHAFSFDRGSTAD